MTSLSVGDLAISLYLNLTTKHYPMQCVTNLRHWHCWNGKWCHDQMPLLENLEPWDFLLFSADIVCAPVVRRISRQAERSRQSELKCIEFIPWAGLVTGQGGQVSDILWDIVACRRKGQLREITDTGQLVFKSPVISLEWPDAISLTPLAVPDSNIDFLGFTNVLFT